MSGRLPPFHARWRVPLKAKPRLRLRHLPRPLPPGDVFGFAIIKSDCEISDEAVWRADNTVPVCDHRYDSGREAPLNGITCW